MSKLKAFKAYDIRGRVGEDLDEDLLAEKTAEISKRSQSFN